MAIHDGFHMPDLLTAFLLTGGMSLLLGLGLREYYLMNQKFRVFGSTRTLMFVALLGFVLFQLQPSGWFYLGGLLLLGGWWAVFYQHKLAQGETGLIGMLLGLMSYTLGPLSLSLPHWFLILYVISALFILNAKERIQRLTQKLANEEVITLAQFLVLSGVILPLMPRDSIATYLPVSVYETWLAVVVMSGFSYLSYLIQTYLMPHRGILLTGAIGGFYSSTAASVVLARESRQSDPHAFQPAAAIVLATGMMYVRLLLMVTFFDRRVGYLLMPEFLALFLVALGVALLLARHHEGSTQLPASVGRPRNPLELNTSLVFALSFLLVTGLTHLLMAYDPKQGLQWMAFLSGFTDIDPFVLAVVGGHFNSAPEVLAFAIVIATASNNLLKAVFVMVVGGGVTRWLGGGALLLLSFLSAAIILWRTWPWG
jgi:uncharacterized membrane protein (DUF4010 family)